MVGAEPLAAVQTGGQFGVAGLQAEQGQLLQGSGRARGVGQQDTHLLSQLGWLRIKLHGSTLRRPSSPGQGHQPSRNPEGMRFLHRSLSMHRISV